MDPNRLTAPEPNLDTDSWVFLKHMAGQGKEMARYVTKHNCFMKDAFSDFLKAREKVIEERGEINEELDQELSDKYLAEFRQSMGWK